MEGIMKTKYRLSEEDHKRLLEASRPVSYMVIGGHPPPSPYDNAMAVWRDLGQKMGFEWRTVEPTDDPMEFLAVPTPEELKTDNG